ncbi:helix-turn-helix transcriptional regulator [Methylobacterium sp. E-005]|uniref:helix-turn-helix domain-containing protein n=1 Tax=Methylobacterium sp. E-005 TaxID=2836549 RepID=UPI0028C507A0|nr:helix-turn-helix transcriptional regulator [Methylobacterium sp. E-005]
MNKPRRNPREHWKSGPAHCRAARGWLDWSQTDLSKRANIGLSTIRQFENGIRTPIANNMLAMRRAFEEAGITLADEPAGISYAGTGAASDKNGTGAAP